MSYEPPADTDQRVVNVEQAEAWNGDDGRHWVEHRERYDAMLRGFTPRLLAAADVSPGQRVLDVGCGFGETTCAAARAAAGGFTVGADLSAPLLDAARRRAEREHLHNVRFDLADVQVHPFPEAGFDVAISRFGVMFFADPAAAFTNIARAVAPGGRLAFLCWQAAADNEWIMTLGAALAAYVELPQMDGDGPGPFSLTDPERIRQLLHQSGFDQVTIDPVTEPIRLGKDVGDVLDYARDLGLVRDLLADVDAATESKALDGIRAAVAPHQTAEGIRIGAAAWLVTARHP